MSLKSEIESLFFIANKPLDLKDFSDILKQDKDKIKKAIQELVQEYQEQGRGVQILEHNHKWQMATRSENSSIVQKFIKEEMTGELTWPSVETLSILAYRGPISKLELDQIRGVNCSLILRNLMIKGLAESFEENNDTFYNITFDFLKYLGVQNIAQLPDYEKLHNDENLLRLIENGKTSEI